MNKCPPPRPPRQVVFQLQLSTDLPPCALQVDSGALQLISEISRKVDGEHSDILRANAAAVADWVDATEASELKAKVLASVADLQKGLLERDTEVSLRRWSECHTG